MSSLSSPRSRPKRNIRRRRKTFKGQTDKNEPIRVMLDGPTSNQLVRDIQFPLSSTFGNNVINLTSSYETTGWLSSSASVPVFNSLYVTLNQFDRVSSYTSVFDQYRIRCCEFHLVPGSSLGVSGGNSGLITSVIDYDDDTNFTTIADAISPQTALTTDGFTHHKRVWKPHVADAVYSGTFTSFANVSDEWIDSGNNNVRHYGIKVGWSVTTSVYAVDIIVRAHIQFRNGR